jgi:hypothetical protein
MPLCSSLCHRRSLICSTAPTTTIIQWQTNAAGFERFSLGTAFRSFIIEYEVALATTQLCFYCGTSHSMHHAFPAAHVVDLILRRRSLFAFLVASKRLWLPREAGPLPKGEISLWKFFAIAVSNGFPCPRLRAVNSKISDSKPIASAHDSIRGAVFPIEYRNMNEE